MSDTDLQRTLDEIGEALAVGKMVFLLDPEDFASVVMSAAAWVMGLPVERNEKLPPLVERIERLAAEVAVSFKDGWWEP